MKFENICPFLRFVRRLDFDSDAYLPPTIPYDARFFYTLSGSSAVIADGTEYTMEKGSLIFIPAGVSYQLITPKESVFYFAVNFDFFQNARSYSVPIPPCYSDAFDDSKITERAHFENSCPFNTVLYLQGMFSILSPLMKIEKESARKLLFFETKISNIFSEVLIKCVRTASASRFLDKKNSVEEILDYIHENFNRTITNTDIARNFGFHPNYISKLIKDYTGLSLHRYLINIRLEYALRLLEAGTSVNETANICGFCDIYHFSKYFKSVFGKSPSSYLKK